MTDLTFEERTVNNNEASKRNDNFSAKFYGIPENYAAVLTRQVRAIGRPTISMDSVDLSRRKGTYVDKGRLHFGDIEVTFFDDDNSITSTIMYVQMMRQQNKYSDKFGTYGFDRDYRFDVEVNVKSITGQTVETYTLKRCFIKQIAHSGLEYGVKSEAAITVTLAVDNVEFKIFDDFLEMG